uniref:Uncharacterized protein n=1 Tax=Vitrella brassicaformis TaxID=1169539 RepID=A0A7S1PA16_9ALVE
MSDRRVRHQVVVDRVNFTAAERREWTAIGEKCGLGPSEVAIIFLDRDTAQCIGNIRSRKARNQRQQPSGPRWTEEEAQRLINDHEAKLERPREKEEGFEGGIYHVGTAEEITALKDAFGLTDKICELREKVPWCF